MGEIGMRFTHEPCGTVITFDDSLKEDDVVRCPGCRKELGTLKEFREIMRQRANEQLAKQVFKSKP